MGSICCSVVVVGHIATGEMVMEVKRILPKVRPTVVLLLRPTSIIQTIKLRNISVSKKPCRSQNLEACKTLHSIGMISETLVRQLTEQKEDVESHWSKYYQPNPKLVRRYFEGMGQEYYIIISDFIELCHCMRVTNYMSPVNL